MRQGAHHGAQEIHQHRDVAACDVLVEISTVEFHRVGGEQRLFAFAAGGLLLQLAGGNAVHRITMRADYVQWGGHGRLINKLDCSNIVIAPTDFKCQVLGVLPKVTTPLFLG